MMATDDMDQDQITKARFAGLEINDDATCDRCGESFVSRNGATTCRLCQAQVVTPPPAKVVEAPKAAPAPVKAPAPAPTAAAQIAAMAAAVVAPPVVMAHLPGAPPIPVLADIPAVEAKVALLGGTVTPGAPTTSDPVHGCDLPPVGIGFSAGWKPMNTYYDKVACEGCGEVILGPKALSQKAGEAIGYNRSTGKARHDRCVPRVGAGPCPACTEKKAEAALAAPVAAPSPVQTPVVQAPVTAPVATTTTTTPTPATQAYRVRLDRCGESQYTGGYWVSRIGMAAMGAAHARIMPSVQAGATKWTVNGKTYDTLIAAAAACSGCTETQVLPPGSTGPSLIASAQRAADQRAARRTETLSTEAGRAAAAQQLLATAARIGGMPEHKGVMSNDEIRKMAEEKGTDGVIIAWSGRGRGTLTREQIVNVLCEAGLSEHAEKLAPPPHKAAAILGDAVRVAKGSWSSRAAEASGKTVAQRGWKARHVLAASAAAVATVGGSLGTVGVVATLTDDDRLELHYEQGSTDALRIAKHIEAEYKVRAAKCVYDPGDVSNWLSKLMTKAWDACSIMDTNLWVPIAHWPQLKALTEALSKVWGKFASPLKTLTDDDLRANLCAGLVQDVEALVKPWRQHVEECKADGKAPSTERATTLVNKINGEVGERLQKHAVLLGEQAVKPVRDTVNALRAELEQYTSLEAVRFAAIFADVLGE